MTTPTAVRVVDPRLAVPSPPSPHLPRPRATALMDRAAAHPVLLVTGPPGSGRTTVVADWVRTRPPACVAWVSMDDADSDPARFDASVRRAAGLPPTGPEDLRTALTVLGPGGVLVLDDVPTPDRVPATLEALVRWPPDGVQVVLVCQAAPPSGTHRRRLSRRLGTLGSVDLAFTGEELAQLLGQEGKALPEQTQDRLLDLTGGWVGPLVQAALDGGEVDLGATSLLGAYLRHEVVGRLPASAADLLVAWSLVTSVDPALARHLVDRDDVAAARADLVARELLVPDASGHLRPHPLLAGAVTSQLPYEQPDLARRLRRSMTQWREADNQHLAALHQAVEDQDWSLVGEVALRSAATAIVHAERSELTGLLGAIPSGACAGDPELTLCRALVAFVERDRQALWTLIDRAEPLLGTLPEPRRRVATLVSRVLEASEAYRDGDAPRVVAAATAADRALAGLSAEQAPGWSRNRGIAQGLLATGEMWAGRPTRALVALGSAIVGFPREEVSDYARVYYLAQLAVAEAWAGSFERARRFARESVEIAADGPAGSGHETQGAWLALAMADLARGDLSAARRAVVEGRLAAGRVLHPFLHASFHLVDAGTALADHDILAARHQLRTVDDLLRARPGMVAVAQAAAATHVVLELRAGSPRAAAAVAADAARAGLADSDPMLLARASLALASGHPDQVAPLVEPLLVRTGAYGAAAWLATARAESARRQDSAAVDALARALDLAAAEEVLLPFHDPDRWLAAALDRHLALVGTHRQLVERARGAASGTATPEAAPWTCEKLTEREHAVLAYLPTMGSNAEIAAALHISENTVKQHLKSVYRKLGVPNRRTAVRVARQRGLLPA